MILFGFRGRRRRLGTVTMACPSCTNTCSHVVARMQRWFTLFFIPIFPFSTKYYSVCSMCSATSSMTRAQAESLAAPIVEHADRPESAPPEGGSSMLPPPA